MESRHKTPSVMAKLMGLEKEPPQHPVKEKQRVLSEKYLQKVASIGFRKRRSSHQRNSLRRSIDEKQECGEVLKVFKTIERDENHKLSTGSRKENPDLLETKIAGVEQQLFNAETLFEPICAFDTEKSVKPGRITEQGNLQLLEKIDSGLGRNVNGETRLYEMLRFSKSQLDSKDGTFPSRIIVLKPNDGKGENSLKCFSLPTSCENYHLGNGLLKDFSSPESSRLFPGIKERKKLADQMESIKQNPTAFSKVSEEVSSQTGDATNRVLDQSSSSFFIRNETCGRSSEMLNPVSNDNPRTGTKDIFHKYWGLRKDTYLNFSPQESKKQNTKMKDCSKHMNHRSNSEKSKSLLSYSFNSNYNEESCISLHKLKKKFFGNNLSEQKPILPKLSTSQPSLPCSDSQIVHQTCLIKDEVKNNKLEHSNTSKRNIASPNSSIYGQLADEETEVVGRPCGNPNNQQSETTACILLGDGDSSSHTSYASIQQEESEFQEDDSVYSVCSETQPDSLGSFEEAYEPSPISVLEPPFGEDISFSSECLKFAGDDLCGSSGMDNEGLGLNVSSDEDCGDRSVGDFEEKQDFVGFFRAEESRDFSYVVEVLTEAGISNASLYTDFCTWHSQQCPISPSIFENLEMKFGKQPSWKRSDRRLLFDRINSALLEILQPCMCMPAWEKPVLRRLNAEPGHDMIEEELWGLLVVQEKEATRESADKMLVGEISWIELRYDIEDIVRQIVVFLIEELAEEVVSLESF